MIKRIYVTKREEVAVEAPRLLREWREQLDLTGLRAVRVWHRYTAEDVDDALWERSLPTIFAEPPLDIWTEDEPTGDYVFATELLPGQYDQRADSAMQCLQLLDPATEGRVAYATVYAVDGTLSEAEKTRLKEYVINPIEAREAQRELPTSLLPDLPQPERVPVLTGFITWDTAELAEKTAAYGLAMEPADLACVQEYFRTTERRDPTLTEMRVLDTYWSDHCRHTTFATALREIRIEEGRYAEPIREAYTRYRTLREPLFADRPRPETLMDLATFGARYLKTQGLLRELDESEEINACTIRIPVETEHGTEEWLLLFKNETHNHPTEIEPFGGAATCLGGCIRDPLSGRAYVYQAMRVTGSGDPRQSLAETLPGKLPQRVITTQAAAGYSSYGNQIGLATGEVKEYYHPGYIAKRMEIGAVVGAVRADQVRREVPAPGDAVVLVGGRTGRDGCGGATGSSKEHDESSLLTAGAEVQKGNAPTERKLQRLFRRPEVSRLIRRCNDFGAGGVAVAAGELADGLKINLDAVPKKYAGLDGTELAISESQERMAVVLAAADAAAFIAHAAEENLEATVIAEVTAEPRLVMHWRGEVIVDIARDFLATNGADREAAAVIEAPEERDFFAAKEVETQADAWQKCLGDLAVASQRGLGERFDGTVGAGTVLMPYGGDTMCTPVAGMAAKIPVPDSETTTASIMTHGFDPYLASWSPFHGGVYAVLSSLAKLVALGGNPAQAYLTLQEYFEKLTSPQSWGKPTAALLGALTAQLETGVGAIGGKDSMSGTFLDLHVPPTLVSFAVTWGDAAQIVSPEWKEAAAALLLVETERDAAAMPNWEMFRTQATALHRAIVAGKIQALSALEAGGLAAACAKAAFGNGIGAVLAEDLTATELFAPRPAAWLVATDEATAAAWQEMPGVRRIGTTGGTAIVCEGERFELATLRAWWEAPLAEIFPPEANEAAPTPDIPLYTQRAPHIRTERVRPRIVIPTMPGTNCEEDTARAFRLAGGEAQPLVLRNRTAAELAESVQELRRAIAGAQIIAFPGGFSAGDEPEGSGKFIAALFRNEYLQEAVHELLRERDGLIIGICNGFQALIKLGLVPYGEIRAQQPDSPTLTYNTIGRHVSRYVTTRVTSTLSPWLRYTEAGDLHRIPCSHGEGRFHASPETVRELAARGQIATQYVDANGLPSGAAEVNPNGSIAAIEGITSPDGRVFGKMGHSERVGRYLTKNIAGSKEQRIFEAGVDYFAK